jgi:hypothetical protein
MGATVSRHALTLRVHRLALAGVTGIWLWSGVLGTGPVLAGEPGGASPRPADARTDGPAPVPAPRRTHAPYVFFPGDGRTTHRSVRGRVQAAPAVDRTSRAYLFFAPGQKSTAPTPAPAVGQTTPIRAPGPPPAVAGVEVADEGLPLPPGRRSFIFFSPERSAAKPGPPPVTHLTARPDLRKTTPLVAVERVPVRLPDTPTRRPHPYLIFQPKPARDRPSSSPKAKGTSSSATPPPASNVVGAVHTPGPAGPGRSGLQADAETPRRMAIAGPGPPTHPVGLQAGPVTTPIDPLVVPVLGRESSIDPADRPPHPFVTAPPRVPTTVRTTLSPSVRSNRTPSRSARDPSAGIVGDRQPRPLRNK